MKVIGVGDNVWDKYEYLRIMFPGGQAVNFAAYARILGEDSAYLGVFGSDKAASDMISTLDNLKIEHSRCRQHQGENGYAKVDLVDGERVFLGSNKGGVAKDYPLLLTKEDLDYIGGFSILHTSNNSYFDSQLPKVAELKVPISYDFSGQWLDTDRVKRVAPYASFAFLSCGSMEEKETKQVCQVMRHAGCKIVIATRGSKGALLYDGSDFYEQIPRLVEAVDTLGAGDSFATAFLLTFLKCSELEPERMRNDKEYYRRVITTAMEKGADFASQTCMVRGAFGQGIRY